jgi:nitroreductase
MNLYETIKKRISVRKYKEESFDDDRKEKIIKIIESCKDIYEGQNLTLKLIENNAPSAKNKVSLGFAGGLVKINAPYCIAAVSEEKEGFLENAGFVQEELVLKLTALGIATCWLGTFNDRYLRQELNLKENKRILNVIALGYAYEGKSFAGSVRAIARADKRKYVEEFAYYKEFGSSIKPFLNNHKSIENICGMSSLYPSSNNGQPVYVIFGDNNARIFIKSRDGSYRDPKRLDAGIFMAHFYLSCLEEGFNVKFTKEAHSMAGGIPGGFHYVNSFSVDKEWN